MANTDLNNDSNDDEISISTIPTITRKRRRNDTIGTSISSESSNKSINALEPITKVRKTVIILRHRQHLIYALNQQIKATKLKQRKPAIDVPTRWNSTYKMLKNFLYLREPIDTLRIKYPKDFNDLALNQREYDLIKELEQLLKDFDAISTKIQAEKEPILSLTILFINYIHKSLITTRDKTEFIDFKNAINKGIDKLIKYYPITASEPKNWDLHLFAGILDPRIKTNTLNKLTRVSADLLKFRLQNEFNLHYSDRLEYHPSESLFQDIDGSQDANLRPNIIKTVLADLYEEEYDDETRDLESELRQYLAEPRVNENIEPLEYWKNSRFTNLRVIARDIFAIIATTAPIERQFSKASEFANPRRRNRLTKTRINELICLKSWDSIPPIIESDNEIISDDTDISASDDNIEV